MQRSLKTRFVKVVCSDRVGTALVRVTHGRARCRGASFEVSGWEPHLAAALMFRLYERAEARFALKYLGDSERVLELGGNRGVVSSILLQRLPDSAELVSVEANPGLVPDLQRNLARNSGGRRVQGRHLALSDGSLVLFDASRGALGSAMSATSGTEVPTTTLDGLVDSLGWDDFALLSDVEGAEASFIEGDGAGLKRCSRMVIELHRTTYRDEPVTIQQLINSLTGRHGFTLLERHRDVCVLVRSM
jgi:FkbM family methyltransferase